MSLNQFARHLTAEISNFALQVSNAGFASIGLDQSLQSSVGKLHLFIRNAGVLPLLGDQKAFGNLQFFKLGIPGKPNDFHAILQGRRNGVQHVGGGDKEHLAQVILDVQVMIHERAVLFRIENFQQCRRGVTAEIHRHLIDLIEHDDGILSAGLLHHLDQLAWQSTYVRAPMAANFRLVPHSAQ